MTENQQDVGSYSNRGEILLAIDRQTDNWVFPIMGQAGFAISEKIRPVADVVARSEYPALVLSHKEREYIDECVVFCGVLADLDEPQAIEMLRAFRRCNNTEPTTLYDSGCCGVFE